MVFHVKILFKIIIGKYHIVPKVLVSDGNKDSVVKTKIMKYIKGGTYELKETPYSKMVFCDNYVCDFSPKDANKNFIGTLISQITQNKYGYFKSDIAKIADTIGKEQDKHLKDVQMGSIHILRNIDILPWDIAQKDWIVSGGLVNTDRIRKLEELIKESKNVPITFPSKQSKLLPEWNLELPNDHRVFLNKFVTELIQN